MAERRKRAVGCIEHDLPDVFDVPACGMLHFLDLDGIVHAAMHSLPTKKKVC